MPPTAYDTAFVARVREPGDPLRLAYPRSLSWLLQNQNADGSFGTTLPIVKERLLATLGGLLALVDLPAALQDSRVHRARLHALNYVWDSTAEWQSGPHPVGFELLLPALLEVARDRRLPLPYDRFGTIHTQREAKIGPIPPRLVYNVPSALLHSLEYLGSNLDVEAIRTRQAANGSFGNSPSATAFFLTRADDARARAYLTDLAQRGDGGIPNVSPFDVFERASVLYNLARAGLMPQEALPHVEHLATALTEEGVGIARDGLRPDSDDTALTLMVLRRYGYPVSFAPLRSFEGTTSFYCFPLERNPSVGANVHVLEALSCCPAFPRQQAVQQKILGFLRDARVDGIYWVDKWHSSPFYATAHSVFALTALAPDLCRPALQWFKETQRPDGSWGWYSRGTPEETAYAVMAWLAAPPQVREGTRVNLDQARRYLEGARAEPATPLWVGKALYAPVHVVEAAVLAAIALLRGRTDC